MRYSGKIKYILFDLDDTLFPSSEFAELARKNALRAMIELGINVEFNDLEHTLERVIKQKGSNYEKHFDDLCRIHKIKRPARYVSAAIAAYHNAKASILPYPEVPLLLLKLREEGYKLYVATNGDAIKQWDKLIRLGIAFYFEDVFVSEEIGQKKGILFFKKIIKKLNAKPKECLVLGDREEYDITPGKKLGVATIRVRRGKYSKGRTLADYELKDLSNLSEIIKRMTH